jgi:hypothetical protein
VDKLGDYFSVKAAAAATGIEYKTLLQRIARGKVSIEKFGRMKVIHKDVVERLREEQTA